MDTRILPRVTSEANPPRERRGIDDFSKYLGMRWESPETIRLEIRPGLLNRAGLLSGPVTFALVDYCMGSALWVHTSEDELIATGTIAINYLQTATEGEIICTSTLDRRNRTAGMLRSEVRHEDGRLMVTALGTFVIFPRRH